MENHIKMDDLGVPLFSETSIYSTNCWFHVSGEAVLRAIFCSPKKSPPGWGLVKVYNKFLAKKTPTLTTNHEMIYQLPTMGWYTNCEMIYQPWDDIPTANHGLIYQLWDDIPTMRWYTNHGLIYQLWDDIPTMRWCTNHEMIYQPCADIPNVRWYTNHEMIYQPWADIPNVRWYTNHEMIYQPWADIPSMGCFLLGPLFSVLFWPDWKQKCKKKRAI